MRVGLLCTAVLSTPHGGIPAVNRQILRQFDRIAEERGVPLEIDAWSLHDEALSPEEAAGAMGMRPDRLRWRGFRGSKAALLAEAARSRPSVDVLLSTHCNLSPVARLLHASARSARVFQFLHGVECWRPLSLRNRWGLASARVFLSNSAFTLRRFLYYNPGYAAVPSRVCWLGTPEDHLPEVAAADAEEADLSVLIVGRIVGEERYKGHEQLLAVWPEVRRRFPAARLDIVGGGNAAGALREEAARRGSIASGAVKLWGEVSDAELRERYRCCSVFAMPSRGEGFGLVYLEAMAFAKPCLASLDDAAAEVVAGEETGLLVRYADREGLLYALCRLLESRALRRRLGEAGRGRVLSHFTERHFGDRLWSALDLP
ncbi:MAG TPA: glycosyltransferase family 4 protein [Polyangiaceae bacterium]|nr:glycosyltransferase family 4 protein [Polyangiaceae bacterium]